MSILKDILQLGSGKKYCVEATNIDLIASTNPDIVHNLEIFPWPLPSNQFKEVRAFDVVEHLNDIVKTLEEIHRVCVNGAVVKITVPHFSCVNAFTDPTHKHYFSSASFNYFTGDNEFDFYTKCRFRNNVKNIIFRPTLINKLINKMANKWPQFYENRWAWIFPAWFIYFELVVVKNES
jgi:hypothetical protein